MFLAIWFCSSNLKKFGKFHNHTVRTGKKLFQAVWFWKVIFYTTAVMDETFRNGKTNEDEV